MKTTIADFKKATKAQGGYVAREWTTSEIAFVESHAKKLSCVEMATHLERSYDSVAACLRKMRASGKEIFATKYGESNPATKYPDEKVEQCKQLRAEGYSFRRISKELGVPHSTVHAWISGLNRNYKP